MSRLGLAPACSQISISISAWLATTVLRHEGLPLEGKLGLGVDEMLDVEGGLDIVFPARLGRVDELDADRPSAAR